MKQRFYIDTSVFGGLFDPEFERESVLLFDMVKNDQVVCLYSDVVERELMGAPVKVQSFFESLSDGHKEKIATTPEIRILAEAYINENVVGKTSIDDCFHIAAATFHKADMLVSWNFKHIVNVYRMRGYNSVNLKFGYPVLSIYSPKEIVYYGVSDNTGFSCG